ncbi:MAG: PilZ domain-containing protein [Thermodesulfobacteriota bacterium]|nr:PilZ domain-containing protein [Thermodesulfobacteriota bacterium]
MREKRKGPRYPVNLHVFFPKFNIWGHTTNISLDGCFVTIDPFKSVGFITDLLVELPVVGVIALKGYVQHLDEVKSGVGLQFVQVRFEPNQSEYYNLYLRFLKGMSYFEELRENYLELVKQDRLKLCTMPSEPEKAKTT